MLCPPVAASERLADPEQHVRRNRRAAVLDLEHHVERGRSGLREQLSIRRLRSLAIAGEPNGGPAIALAKAGPAAP
jgi:hypothetical protein